MTTTSDIPARIATAAADWVARREAGLSAGEQARLQVWLAEDSRHGEALRRLEASWAALDRPRLSGKAAEFRTVLAATDRRQRRRHRRRFAAGVALMVVLAGAAWVVRAPFEREVAGAVAAPRIIEPERRTLADGSVVESPAGARFRIEFSAQTRRIVLERGEAYFEVAHDAGRPFIVAAGGVDVRAVGTVFSVHLQSAAVSVLVTEGRVAVGADRAAPSATASSEAARPTTPAPVLLDAGQQVAVPTATDSARNAVVETFSAGDLDVALGWRRRQIEFSHTPLSGVVALLNRYNRAQLTVEGAGVAAIPVSGRFRADDTEAFLSVLRAGFGVAARERAPDDWVLSAAP